MGTQGKRESSTTVASALALLVALAVLALAACGGGNVTTATPSASHPATPPAVTPATPTKSTTAAAGEAHAAMFRANLERTGVYPAGGPSRLPKLLWTFRTTSVASMEYVSSPTVADGLAYVGSQDRYLYAVDTQSGRETWKFKTGDWVRCPAVADGVVYVGSHDHYLYALDARSGRQRWKFKASGPVTTEAAVRDGVVYCGSWDNLGTPAAYGPSGHHLYAVDVRSGRERWEFDPHGVVTSPAVAGGTAYVGSDDGYVYAVDTGSGEQKWRFYVGRGYWGVQSSPVLSGGAVYFGSNGPKRSLYALDATSGRKLWAFPTGGALESSPAICNGVVYFTDLTYGSDSLACGRLCAVK